MAPRGRMASQSGEVSHTSDEQLLPFLAFAIILDVLQTLFGFLLLLPFVGFPFGFFFPPAIGMFGVVVMLIGIRNEGVHFTSGKMRGRKLWGAILILAEIFPLSSINWGFTWGTLWLVRATLKEQRSSAHQGASPSRRERGGRGGRQSAPTGRRIASSTPERPGDSSRRQARQGRGGSRGPQGRPYGSDAVEDYRDLTRVPPTYNE